MVPQKNNYRFYNHVIHWRRLAAEILISLRIEVRRNARELSRKETEGGSPAQAIFAGMLVEVSEKDSCYTGRSAGTQVPHVEAT